MAELVTVFITVLREKLASLDLSSFTFTISEKLRTFDDILLNTISVLDDACEKQITDSAIKMWVENLHHLAYDVDDLFYELEMVTVIMRREARDSSITGKVLKIIPTSCTNFNPINMKNDYNIRSKLDDLLNRFNTEVSEGIGILGLNVNFEVGYRANRRLIETSLLDESKLLGRDRDKEELFEKLLGNEASNQNVTVVSVVGMSGIGKTTLAKVLYNDVKVTDHFELRAWVCVLEDLDLLQVALREKLSNKRFLVMLDDVWNEDHNQWALLKSPFLKGAPGTKILVTSRTTEVAYIMNSIQPYHLKSLSYQESLSLFAQQAQVDENIFSHPHRKKVIEGILNKCDGMPLALVMLGRHFKTKTNVEEWEEELNGDSWNVLTQSNILVDLK
ncbi:putative disease resistance protein RGA4 [Rutidosis leptorrhynchoides]|uniref:putative disease resistance protein RGA4 n=1 Tax=Rutidosis leptorrhynchoides TaxID=125765 RepID=UPI003A99D6DB